LRGIEQNMKITKQQLKQIIKEGIKHENHKTTT